MSDDLKTDIGTYDEEGAPPEENAPIPKFLIITYWAMAVFGILWWVLFWNGSSNTWFDRGTWSELQQAARTTWNSDS